MLEDEPRRQLLGAAARERALERYAWDTLARRLLEIYQELTDTEKMRGSTRGHPLSEAAKIQVP